MPNKSKTKKELEDEIKQLRGKMSGNENITCEKKDNEISLDNILYSSNQLNILVDCNRKIVGFSNKADEYIKLVMKKRIVKYEDALTCIVPENRDSFIKFYTLALQGKSNVVEKSFQVEGGKYIWFEFHYDPIFKQNNEVAGVNFWALETTGRKLSEEKLKESEFHFSEAQRIANIGSFEFAIDGTSQKWSSETFRIFERDPVLKELNLQEFINMVHPDDRETLQYNMDNFFLKKKKAAFEYRVVLTGNIIKFISCIGQPVTGNNGEVVKIIGVVMDVTKLKLTEIENENYRNHLESLVDKRTIELRDVNNKLEQEVYEREVIAESLKQSEERWQYAIEGSDDGIWDWDITPNKIYFSDRWRQIMEVKSSEFVNEIEDWYIRVHPEDVNRFKYEVNKHLQGESQQFSVEYRLNCKTGIQKWLLVRGKVMSWSDGKPLRMLGTLQDFTERKIIEDALSWELDVNSALAGLSSSLLSEQLVTFQEIAESVLNICKDLTKSKFGFAGYIDPNTGFFTVPTLTHEIYPAFKMEDKQVVFKEFKGLWGWVLNNRKPIISNNVQLDPRSTGIPKGHISIKRFISAPAVFGDELLGQISLANSDIDYTDKDLKLLTRLASFFAIIIQRKRTMDALQESEQFLQSTLDALPAHIAILDSNGVIMAVNKSWENFADKNNFTCSNYGIGMNYLDICKESKGAFSEEAPEVYLRIRSVLNNRCEKFELEYPCHSSEEKRWFLLKVNRFQGEGGVKLVVSHENVTKRKEYEQKIKSQYNFLRNILRSLTYPFFVVDARDYKVKMANQAAKNLYKGMSEGCLCYSLNNASDLCGSHDQSCMIEIVKRTKKPAIREREIKDESGNVKIFSVHGYPIINLRGEVIQIIEYCIDITERRNAEMKLLLQSTALESADNAIVITDFDGNITWVNAAFSLLSGYSFEEIIGNNPRILKSGSYEPSFYEELWRTIKSGKVWRGELLNKKKNGELYTEEMTITPVRDIDDKTTHFIAIKQDVSDRIRAQQEIKEALGKEKELNELRSRFVSTISHEFRTPLTSILASAELLERYNERWTNEKKIDTLKRIQASVDYMNEMIGDVLTINKADSGKIEFIPRPVKIIKFCKELLEEVKLSATQNHNISFNYNCDEITLLLDEKLLRHIISNLLSNAIKYSPNGGEIEFSINLEEETLSIIVKDHGIGITVEDQNKLFEPFFRGKNINSIPGTGLGLSILKRAVDLHKGIIFFESEPGAGTTFYVKIPLNLR